MNESDAIWPNTRRIRPYQQAVIMLLEVSSRTKSLTLCFGDPSFSAFEVRWFSREVNQCAPIAIRLRMVLVERVPMPTLFFSFLRLFLRQTIQIINRNIFKLYFYIGFTRNRSHKYLWHWKTRRTSQRLSKYKSSAKYAAG